MKIDRKQIVSLFSLVSIATIICATPSYAWFFQDRYLYCDGDGTLLSTNNLFFAIDSGPYQLYANCQSSHPIKDSATERLAHCLPNAVCKAPKEYQPSGHCNLKFKAPASFCTDM